MDKSAWPPITRRSWLVLALVVAAAFLLRAVRIGEPPGGYLVYNEGYYLDLATREFGRSLMAWLVHPLDFYNPPLYPVLVSDLFRVVGPSIAAARMVSISAGLLAVVVVFLLGRLVYDERTGLIAAAVLAFMPGVVLVNHNAQVDSLFVALMLAGACGYVLSARAESTRFAGVAGVLLGLAILTKQPAVLALLVLAVWETWRTMGFAWLRARRVWVFAAVTLAVGGSWYLVQAVVSPAQLFGALNANASREAMTSVVGHFWTFALSSELAWMVFPLAAVVALFGVGYQLWQRKAGDRLVLSFLAVYLLYYVAFHLHSYYLLPLTPFLALAIARAFTATFTARREWGGIRTALLLLLIASMAFGSVMTLGGQKWGRWSPGSLSAQSIGSRRLFVSPTLEGYYGPTLQLLDPRTHYTISDFSTYRAQDATALARSVYLGPPIALNSQPVTPVAAEKETWIRPVLFGFAVGQLPGAGQPTQVFTNTPWRLEQVGPFWRFGLSYSQHDSGLFLYQ